MTIFNFLQAHMSYTADKTRYKAEKAWQTYSNVMKDLSATVAQNSITRNELTLSDAYITKAAEIKKSGMFSRSQVEVSAASAGVSGNSVNRVMREVIGASASEEAERQDEYERSMRDMADQRRQIQIDAALSQDYSYIPKPKAASYYLTAIQKSVDNASKMFTPG